ncbi:hypothetical protein [Sphingomonas sp. ERG5]|uniref:hypothetical protein n=1 Tax=Sphingomonas sp. ERG5 TaxID=1381597 RepID=UPI00054BCAA1|nr:hypothetical protein [Sphingomonas sp. ERG5]
MSLFPETIAASLAGTKVEAAYLIHFDFTTQPMRLWRGNGLLKTKDNATWSAIGQLGSVTGIEQAVNGEAPVATFTLSGVDQRIVRLARDEFKPEVDGRLATVLVQFFGEPDDTDPDNQRPLDFPFPMWAGRCLTPTFTIEQGGEHSVSIAAESVFALRSRPNYAMYTDRDQQHRFAGDRGFEFTGTLVNKVVTWPDY